MSNLSFQRIRHENVTRRTASWRVACAAACVVASPRLALGQTRAVHVAVTLDRSGPEKGASADMLLGSTACIAAINASGGVNRAPIELIVSDDQFKPEHARENALAFGRNSSVIAILHPMGTAQTAAVIESVPDMAIIGPATGAAALRTKPGRNTFWTRVSNDREVEKLVDTAVSAGMTRLGLVHYATPGGRSFLAAFSEAVSRRGLQPAALVEMKDTSEANVVSAVAAIARADVQAVILGVASGTPALVRALKGARIGAAIYSISLSPNTIRELGPSARGVGFSIVVPPPHSSKFDICRRYQSDMKALGSNDYSLYGLEGYIAAQVLVEALRRVLGQPNRASLLRGLEGIGRLDLGGVSIGFGKGKREGGGFVDVAVVGPDGKLLV